MDLERKFEFPFPKKIKDKRLVFEKSDKARKPKLLLLDSWTLSQNDAITLYNDKTKCHCPPKRKIYSNKRNVPAKLPYSGGKSTYQIDYCCDCCVRKIIVYCDLVNKMTQVVR